MSKHPTTGSAAPAELAPIPSKDRWGPWADVDPGERRARLRSMRALTRVLCGPRGAELAAHLARAEWDPEALPAALGALERLPSVDRRHLLTSYAALARAA